MSELQDEQERINEQSAQNNREGEQLEFQFSPLDDKRGNRLEAQISANTPEQAEETDSDRVNADTLNGEQLEFQFSPLNDKQGNERSLFGRVQDKIGETGDKVRNAVRDRIETVSKTASDLKNSIKDTASNLDVKKMGYMAVAGLAAASLNTADRIEEYTFYQNSDTYIGAQYQRDHPQVSPVQPVNHAEAPGMPPAADTTDERLAELASSMEEVQEGKEPGQEVWGQIVLKDGSIANIVLPKKEDR